MSRTLRVVQLNVRKQGEVHDSLMNDVEIRDATFGGYPGTPSAEDSRTTPDDPHGPSQMDKDGPVDVEGR